jgi:hypothetical protein
MLFTFIYENKKILSSVQNNSTTATDVVVNKEIIELLDCDSYNEKEVQDYAKIVSEKINTAHINDFLENNGENLFYKSLLTPSLSLSRNADCKTVDLTLAESSLTNPNQINYVTKSKMAIPLTAAVQLFMKAEEVADEIVNNAAHILQQSVIQEFKETFDYEKSSELGFFNYFETHYKAMFMKIIIEIDLCCEIQKQKKVVDAKQKNTFTTTADWRNNTIVEGENGKKKLHPKLKKIITKKEIVNGI